MSHFESGFLFVLVPWFGLLALFAAAEGLDRLAAVAPDGVSRMRSLLRMCTSRLDEWAFLRQRPRDKSGIA